MATVRDRITDSIAAFISKQHVFFVATAPGGAGGHVNLSPKGLDTFKIVDDHTVAYMDLTGSGVETIAHLRENGRITIMFCAFDGNPEIVRLSGRGEVIPLGTSEAAALLGELPGLPGARSAIKVTVDRVSTSCGYGVPLMHYETDRSKLLDWAEKKGRDGLSEYRADKNAKSIDGLPGL
jgi:Pyridoxamine 5'-phosphate oxidase